MDIRYNRDAQVLFDLLQDFKPFFQTRAAESRKARTICFIEGSFENIGQAHLFTDGLGPSSDHETPFIAFQDAGTSHDKERMAGTDFVITNRYGLHVTFLPRQLVPLLPDVSFLLPVQRPCWPDPDLPAYQCQCL